MEYFVLISLIILTIIGVALEALVLHVLTIILKLKSKDYKNALIVVIIGWLAAVIIGYLLLVILPAAIYPYLNIVLIVMAFIIFHLLMKKIYFSKLAKNLAIYILFSILTAILSLAVIIPVRLFLVEPYNVQNASMEPALADNDYVLAIKFLQEFKRGDIVMFSSDMYDNRVFIKRIIGLPNDKIVIKNGEIIVYNTEYPDGVMLKEEDYLPAEVITDYYGTSEYNLAADEYFVLGDERSSSLDSRRFGPIKKYMITGKYWLTIPLLKNK